jgi:hypothetical protein
VRGVVRLSIEKPLALGTTQQSVGALRIVVAKR